MNLPRNREIPASIGASCTSSAVHQRESICSSTGEERNSFTKNEIRIPAAETAEARLAGAATAGKNLAGVVTSQLALVQAVAAAVTTPLTVVTLTAVPLDLTPLLRNPKVGAILHAGQPSVQSSTGLARTQWHITHQALLQAMCTERRSGS